MKKLFVGIDLSMNSTGVCFKTDSENLYLNILNRNVLSKNKKLSDEEILDNYEITSELLKLDNVIMHVDDREPIPVPKKIGLSEWGRRSVLASNKYSTNFVDIIKNIISERFSGHQIFVCIENYSYTKHTNNIINMVEFTFPIKEKLLLSGICPLENFYLVTSPEIKMGLGNGNYDKYELLMCFINNKMGDKNVTIDNFNKFAIEKVNILTKTGKKKGKTINEVLTPISDLVDSYFLASWLQTKLS